MKVTWLTHSGLVFENERLTVLVDPYLSDSLGEKCDCMKRRVPVQESFLELRPDVVLITHSHPDHLDVATLDRFLKNTDKEITVLANGSAYDKLASLGYRHNLVLLSPHSVWSEGGVTFYAVSAAHSDTEAAGYIIDDGDRTFYVTGDTLYNYDVIDEVLELVEDGVDYCFLPINGVGNNMNAKDASDFAYEIGARRAVPLHYGLFDEIEPTTFDFEDGLILMPYQPTKL